MTGRRTTEQTYSANKAAHLITKTWEHVSMHSGLENEKLRIIESSDQFQRELKQNPQYPNSNMSDEEFEERLKNYADFEKIIPEVPFKQNAVYRLVDYRDRVPVESDSALYNKLEQEERKKFQMVNPNMI